MKNNKNYFEETIDFQMRHDEYKSALESIELLTKN